ncbi:MAG: isoprenyl transferase [Proteobacteria bacterium]|nr:isoprenyl transferase [Pseudomonadota bacterium]MDE3208137.1 isoprenyl transferase [Pseudomonadota bacterium]
MTLFGSSTQQVPQARCIPQHIAIIMDGNGRWAKKRFLPRVAGHRQGVIAVRGIIKACAEFGVDYLTLFAFSSENWRRPKEEVNLLMELFVRSLEAEIEAMHENNIRLKVIGDISSFSTRLQNLIREGVDQTQNNLGLTLTIAANYGGRWDIMQAIKQIADVNPQALVELNEADLLPYLAMHYAPEPDLFIRTGGEMRISNFLLWQLAYTELYFTPILWPDFDKAALSAAIDSYQGRERRFGRTSEQLEENV